MEEFGWWVRFGHLFGGGAAGLPGSCGRVRPHAGTLCSTPAPRNYCPPSFSRDSLKARCQACGYQGQPTGSPFCVGGGSLAGRATVPLCEERGVLSGACRRSGAGPGLTLVRNEGARARRRQRFTHHTPLSAITPYNPQLPLHNSKHHNATHTTQHNAAQPSATQHSTAQHIAAQHSAGQH